jgi:predicted secreted protein
MASQHDQSIADIVYDSESYNDAIRKLAATGQLRDGTLYVTQSQHAAIYEREASKPIDLEEPKPVEPLESIQVIVTDNPRGD